MATITIETGKETDRIADSFGFREDATRDSPFLSAKNLPDETKEDFIKRMLIEYIKQNIEDKEVNEAADKARADTKAEMNLDEIE